MRTKDRGCPFKSINCNESFIPYPYLLVCMGAEFSKPGPPQKLALRGPFMLGSSQKSVSTNRFVKFSADRRIPKGIRRKLYYTNTSVLTNVYVGFILCTLLPVTRIRFFNDIGNAEEKSTFNQNSPIQKYRNPQYGETFHVVLQTSLGPRSSKVSKPSEPLSKCSIEI